MVCFPIQLHRQQSGLKKEIPELVAAPGIIMSQARRPFAGVEAYKNNFQSGAQVIRKLLGHLSAAARPSSGTGREIVATSFSARAGRRFPPGAIAPPPGREN